MYEEGKKFDSHMTSHSFKFLKEAMTLPTHVPVLVCCTSLTLSASTKGKSWGEGAQTHLSEFLWAYSRLLFGHKVPLSPQMSFSKETIWYRGTMVENCPVAARYEEPLRWPSGDLHVQSRSRF